MTHIQSSDGKHLGFMPVFHWTDLLGVAQVHHGNRYRTRAEAEAAIPGPKPATWADWTAEVRPISTWFAGPFVCSKLTICQLIDRELAAASLRRKAA